MRKLSLSALAALAFAAQLGAAEMVTAACERRSSTSDHNVSQPANTLGPATRRPFRVDDLFESETISAGFGGPATFSADGTRLAFVRVRAQKTLPNSRWIGLYGNERADVWVQLDRKSAPVNVTNGIEDGSGWFSPQWSPDGQKLAMLSTRGGGVRLWVWDVQQRDLRLSTERLASQFTAGPLFAWLDSRHLVYLALSNRGEARDILPFSMSAATRATAAWERAFRGREATVSAMVSDNGSAPTQSEQDSLILVDAVSPERNRTLVSDVSIQAWQASRGGAIAFVRRMNVRMTESERTSFRPEGDNRLEIVDASGKQMSIHGALPARVVEDSLHWSASGDELTVLGYPTQAGHDQARFSLFILDRKTGTFSTIALTDVAAEGPQRPSIEWTADGSVLLRASLPHGVRSKDPTQRAGWWVISKRGHIRSLERALGTTPTAVFPAPDGGFVSLADGHLWRARRSTSSPQNLTRGAVDKVQTLARPRMLEVTGVIPKGVSAPYDSLQFDQIVFTGTRGGRSAQYRLDLRSGRVSELTPPTADARLMAYSSAADAALFLQDNESGLALWRQTIGGTTSAKLVDTNRYLLGIAPAKTQCFSYSSLDGRALEAKVLLPFGFVPGHRYPVVTWVYSGWDMSAVSTDLVAGVSSSFAYNLQILAAQGYAVLLPSMPADREGIDNRTLQRLPNGVLPAVDKLIELGIADPQRLAVMGQSFGGYSTYGLIAQTDRFKAAVASAGPSDLISLYGQFSPATRYSDSPQEDIQQRVNIERSQPAMGTPPWKNWWGYLQNSPLYFADRVQTPVMIIQGDNDEVPMAQGEEFFTVLNGLGKPAQLVRYWGEGHVLRSAANIRDAWERILGWFDKYLPRTAEEKQAVEHSCDTPLRTGVQSLQPCFGS